MPQPVNKKTVILTVWLALLVGLAALVPWLAGQVPPPPERPAAPAPHMDSTKLAAQWPQIVAHAAAPPRGSAKTPYTLAEFGDFQCPQCGKARPLLEALLAQYPRQVNLIFIHRPFPQLHKWAIPAAQASEVAAAQGKFWPMYDLLYSNQENLESGYYGNYAAQVGMNKAAFTSALAANQGMNAVSAASQFSSALDIQETPTILLRDNTKGAVKIFVGLQGTKNLDGSPQYPGVLDLMAHPPWSGKGM